MHTPSEYTEKKKIERIYHIYRIEDLSVFESVGVPSLFQQVFYQVPHVQFS